MFEISYAMSIRLSTIDWSSAFLNNRPWMKHCGIKFQHSIRSVSNHLFLNGAKVVLDWSVRFFMFETSQQEVGCKSLANPPFHQGLGPSVATHRLLITQYIHELLDKDNNMNLIKNIKLFDVIDFAKQKITLYLFSVWMESLSRMFSLFLFLEEQILVVLVIYYSILLIELDRVKIKPQLTRGLQNSSFIFFK